MSVLKDIGTAVMGVAPLVGTILGGPATGVAVGAVTKLLSATLGVDPDKPDDILKAITTDPKALVKIRELEMNHEAKLQDLLLEETRIYLGDLDSARQREVSITKATGKREWHLYILAYCITILFFGLLGVLSFRPMPQANTSLLNIMLGAVVASFSGVVSYFFGSSKGSSDKTDILRGKV